jgi:hypothetical protein
MSEKKSSFSFANLSRSRKFKPFSLNKLFHLAEMTKNIVQCKSSKHSNNANYEFCSYQKSDETTRNNATTLQPLVNNSSDGANESVSFMDMSVQPATSTMIDTRTSTYVNSDQRYEFEENETCKSCLLSHSPDTTGNRWHDEPPRIVNAQNKSPIVHTYYNLNNDYDTDYLHSTKYDESVQEGGKSANLANIMSDQSSIMAAPTSASTSYSASFSNNSTSSAQSISDELFCQISAFESVIEGLSVTLVNDYSGSESHVCGSDYTASFEGDVTVQFADTIKILKDNNDEYLYVRVASDGRQGFVPRTIVMDLKQFIQQLRNQHSELLAKSYLN